MISTLITIAGLAIFETISSIDNAIVNAEVLKTLPPKYRKFFLLWGLLLAVVLVRGALPLIIVWIANPSLSFGQLITTSLSGGPAIEAALGTSKPLLLIGGGMYLLLVFLSWLFLEEKRYAFFVEGFIHRQSVWFYAITSIVVTTFTYLAININPQLALAASIGVSVFFITDGFKQNAEKAEKQMISGHMSAISKLLYLEVLDASFSIDGVIGAFAFTLSVPLILIGNGLGAWIVRECTIKGINLVEKLAFLKNGAMYSIGILGAIMIAESFGHEFPFWLAPLNTIVILAIFLFLSYRELKMAKMV